MEDTEKEWDWEILVGDSENIQHQHQQQHNDNTNSSISNPNSEIDEERERDDLESSTISDSPGVIRSDYFSLEFNSENMEIEVKSNNSNKDDDDDDPEKALSGSWMDPGQAQFPSIRAKRRRNSSDDETVSPISDGSGSGSGLVKMILEPHSDCTNLQFPEMGSDEMEQQNQVGVDQEFHENEGVDIDMEMNVDNNNDNSMVADNSVIEKQYEAENENENKSVGNNNEIGNEKGNWWRVPLEVIKYCVLRVRPVWSLSMAAAAIMGFVLLRRAWLVKMKRKTQQGLRLNVTVDDKKVSQFMSRAARLNEAFSVVKRVPIIRPSLPAPGSATWPVMSMR